MSRRLPAEWEPQDGVLLTWPHAATDWCERLDEVEQVYVEIAAAVTRYEAVLIACHNPAHRDHVASLLQSSGIRNDRCRLAQAASNDSWARDHGPITVINNNFPLLLDFKFNGWGDKYPYDLDNAITRRLAAAGHFGATEVDAIDLVLEGGGIESDGNGTLLTTSSCLLAPTRNQHLSDRQIEDRLHQLLGVERFLWLHHGRLQGDDTDGHIDTLARFCNQQTIAYVSCDDTADPHFEEFAKMAEELNTFRDVHGHPYRLVPLPWPSPKYDHEGRRLPATYANFLVINGAVLVPTYGDAADRDALDVLRGCFWDRDIIGIDCSALIRQNGSLHCVTMQLPRGVLANPLSAGTI